MTGDKVAFNDVGDFGSHSPSEEGTPNGSVTAVAGSGIDADDHSTIEYDQSTVRWDRYEQFDRWNT